MSYLVLARKWRPQSFSEVVGQEHIKRSLQNAIRYNRLPHALLFSGPKGVGKTTMARILAKALNCERGPSIEPCNKCISCKEIDLGNSIDVQEIDGASNRRISEVREIRENVKYRPSRGRYKVYIIDEVHMLTEEAFNALLKTLEEPPPHVIFVFATTEPHKVPPTIVSRCQRFPFHRISSSIICHRISEIASAEKIDIEEDAIRLIAHSSEGSLRDALSLLDQLVSFSTPPINVKDVQEILGLFDTHLVLETIDAILNGDLKKVLETIHKIYEEGSDLKQFYLNLITYFRHLLIAKLTERASLVDLPDYEWEILRNIAKNQSISHLEQLFDLLISEQGAIKATTQPRFILEALLIKMAEFKKVVPIEVIIERLSSLKKEAVRKGEIVDEKVAEEDREDIKEKIIPAIRRESPVLAAILENAKIFLKDEKIFIKVLQFHKELIMQKNYSDILNNCIQNCFGKDFVVLTNGPESYKEDDLVQEVLKIFGGKVSYIKGR
ncbi:MAG: DNA polymerase III subunit gamma/tau [Deltaproteobacteria bacterium]|nr:DNA polymerase III subunit gamma/tau [Deltaproteobacteria bacterium]